MKKLTALLLCLGICFTLNTQSILAAETPNDEAVEYVTDNGDVCINAELISVTDTEIENPLLRGTSKPSSTWNLSSNGSYTGWTVSTHGSIIYSNYKFTGHTGTVHLQGYENGGESGSYIVRIYGKKTYTYSCTKGQWFFITNSELSSNESVYFSITSANSGGYTYVSNGIFEALN